MSNALLNPKNSTRASLSFAFSFGFSLRDGERCNAYAMLVEPVDEAVHDDGGWSEHVMVLQAATEVSLMVKDAPTMRWSLKQWMKLKNIENRHRSKVQNQFNMDKGKGVTIEFSRDRAIGSGVRIARQAREQRVGPRVQVDLNQNMEYIPEEPIYPGYRGLNVLGSKNVHFGVISDAAVRQVSTIEDRNEILCHTSTYTYIEGDIYEMLSAMNIANENLLEHCYDFLCENSTCTKRLMGLPPQKRWNKLCKMISGGDC
ncbi:hypothetical protein LR48_Vigan03g081300 [Vigna angularis]|uniref:Uncharacterized protein n=1 Tax=Phaseolus angularis TaxID=3914 RepID=A0A0L9U3S0_PHAAN|nr:hypothetical protein LR48_Vigan03g081300 [Vigna angularis]